MRTLEKTSDTNIGNAVNHAQQAVSSSLNIDDLKTELKDVIKEAKNTVKETADTIKLGSEAATQYVKKATKETKNFIKEHPIACIGMAFALGVGAYLVARQMMRSDESKS